jgi:1-aminocyclopropane-1-carboxylate deaminase
MVGVPSPLSGYPRELLLFDHPSPIQALPRLSAAFSPSDFGITIWAKREDTNSPFAFGGNKIRKLEYVVADALEQGADTLVTEGGLQSNHTRQTAAVAAHLGLKAVLIHSSWTSSPDPGYDKLANIQLSRLMGAETRIITPTETSTQEILDELVKEGRKPYHIPVGASLHPLGGLGFARFAFEVLEQEVEKGVFFDEILTACVSGSTLGGVIAGFKLIEKRDPKTGKRRITGIAGAPEVDQLRKKVLSIAQNTAKKIGLKKTDITADDVNIDDRFHAGQYGKVDNRTRDALKDAASLEGMILDPVYTGKAMAGMMEMVKNGELKRGSNMLFVHTGGQIALNVYGGEV